MEKICSNCGSPLDDGVKFCPNCGAAVSASPAEEETAHDAPAETPAPTEAAETAAPTEEKKQRKPRKKSSRQLLKSGEKVSENIYFCEDGKYRWVYELGLFKTPTIYILIWKIFFFIMLGVFTLMFFVSLGDSDFFWEGFLGWLKAFGIALAAMSVIVFLGYALYAAMMGGKYIVIFEMDENGINHKQIPSQAKKAQAISKATIIAGLATGRLSMIGAGIGASRTEMYTGFEKVRKVKAYPRQNLIKVNELLSHNQVYAEKEDFEFVMNYITERCVNVKGKK